MPVDLLPARIVLSLASPYIAGRDAEQALNLAHDLYAINSFTGTMDVLGEASTSTKECQDYVDIYKHVIDLISNNPLLVKESRKQLTVSFKPSMFCASASIDLMPSQKAFDAGYERMEKVVKYAYEHNIAMTLEAEDARWADYHLDSYFSLFNSGYTNLGTVLQTRLFRTKDDIKRFNGTERVRLVIGIYEESADIAYTDKKQMKDLLIEYSRELLEKGVYVELATHDQNYIEKFVDQLAPSLNLNADKFEIQFLMGVPRYKLQKTLVESGVLVRLYLPFGSDESAAPYCKRRLKGNPNLLVYGLKNLIGLQ